MKILNWNVNSLAIRLEQLANILQNNDIDVVALQEIKGDEEKFPYERIKELGYFASCDLQKAYNGVALLSKKEPKNVVKGLNGFNYEEARYIQAEIDGIKIASVYAPNGNPVASEKYEKKNVFNKCLINHVKQMLVNEEQGFLLTGDFNIAYKDEDVANTKDWSKDAIFTRKSRLYFNELLNLGLTDAFDSVLKQGDRRFTWWDYRAGSYEKDKGARIDHYLLSPLLASYNYNCYVMHDARVLERPSDHAPVVLELNV